MPYIAPKYDFQGNSTAITGSQPVPASASDALMNYDEFYKQYTGYSVNPDSLFGKIDNFFTGKESSARQAYENYVADYEFKKNQAAASAANKETYAREDSQIQRLMADYAAAGLNPYMLLSGGNLSSGVVSSGANYGHYNRYSKTRNDNEKAKNTGKALTSAIKAIAFIAMMAA